MRENTRCEVDDPMSTPTESTHSSSSSPKVRPVLEKKMRPPICSVMCGQRNSLSLRQQSAVVALIIFLPQKRILHVIGDRGAAFGNIHRRVVDMFLARRSRLAAGIVRAEPCGEAERVLRCAEMLMKPACATGRRRHHADRLVIDAFDVVALAILPGREPQMLRPGVSVAFAFDADQHRRGRMCVRLRIVTVLVLPDPKVKSISSHERFDTPPTR